MGQRSDPFFSQSGHLTTFLPIFLGLLLTFMATKHYSWHFELTCPQDVDAKVKLFAMFVDDCITVDFFYICSNIYINHCSHNHHYSSVLSPNPWKYNVTGRRWQNNYGFLYVYLWKQDWIKFVKHVKHLTKII